MGSLGTLFDATAVAWKEKLRHNAVRPVSAIRYLYDHSNVTSWAGPYRGTGDIQGREYTSYLRTMPHADYPSGTACICVAFAEFLENFFGGDAGPTNVINYGPYIIQKGCSIREAGAVPCRGRDCFLQHRRGVCPRLHPVAHVGRCALSARHRCQSGHVSGHRRLRLPLLFRAQGLRTTAGKGGMGWCGRRVRGPTTIRGGAGGGMEERTTMMLE